MGVGRFVFLKTDDSDLNPAFVEEIGWKRFLRCACGRLACERGGKEGGKE